MSSMSRPQLPRELAEADNLPTPPGVALEVMRLADDPNIEAEDIGRLIRTDPALTVRMLRAVNSAAYGLPQTIDSVPRACALLGLQKTKTLALGFAVVDSMPVVDASSGLDLSEYWLRSALTASAAELMALRVHRDGADVAYVVGLLSELGRLVLASCLTSTYKTVLVDAPWPSTDLERERLGFSNTDVTAALLSSWSLPDEIVMPIAHRDRPDLLPTGSSSNVIRLCRILAAASILATEWSAGENSRGLSWAGDAASHYLKMSPDVFAGIVEELRSRVEDMSLFVDASPPGQVDSRRLATEASERLKESLARSRSESKLTQLLRAAEV